MAGYAPTAWTCTNGDGGAFDAGTVTVAAGDAPVTCSITNDDQPVQLTVVKRIINDDGGTAIVDDFGITTSAGTLAFGAAVEAPTDTFTYTAATLEVAPGTYTLAELAVAGYAPTAWTCTNGGGGAFDAGTVTVAAGDEPVTCSITNDDIACPTPPAGDQGPAVILAAAPAPQCDGGVLPETDIGSGTQGPSPSGDSRIPWLAVLLTALIAIVVAGVVLRRRWRSLDVA